MTTVWRYNAEQAQIIPAQVSYEIVNDGEVMYRAIRWVHSDSRAVCMAVRDLVVDEARWREWYTRDLTARSAAWAEAAEGLGQP